MQCTCIGRLYFLHAVTWAITLAWVSLLTLIPFTLIMHWPGWRPAAAATVPIKKETTQKHVVDRLPFLNISFKAYISKAPDFRGLLMSAGLKENRVPLTLPRILSVFVFFFFYLFTYNSLYNFKQNTQSRVEVLRNISNFQQNLFVWAMQNT